MTLFLFYAIVVVLGVLSMGFQMLASRLLGPQFGSTIVEWGWLIATFLAAFSTGSILGGWISNRAPARRQRLQIATAAVCLGALTVTVFFGKPLLEWLSLKFIPNVSDLDDQSGGGMNRALFVSCLSLFFVPVAALSTFGPQCVGWLAARGKPSGLASGVVYGVSTLGNIVGVMLTGFFLIPRYGVSRLLEGWLIVAAASLTALIILLRRATPPSSP